MKKRNYLFLGFFLWSTISLFGQRKGTSINFYDLNGDGITDTLKSSFDEGSGFSTQASTLINGKTKEIFHINTESSFSQIKTLIYLPPALYKKKNKAFLSSIEKHFQIQRRQEIDPSLSWILDAEIKNQPIDQTEYFDRLIHAPIKWQEGVPKIPLTYTIEIKGEKLKNLWPSYLQKPKSFSKKSKARLKYYGHNHFRYRSSEDFMALDSSKNFTLIKSAHGLILKKENSFAWIYVNDNDLVGGPQKLRWESIMSAKIIGKFILLQQSLPPDTISRLWLIDTETGNLARLKTPIESNEDFSVKSDRLYLKQIVGKKVINLDDLFQKMNYLFE